MPREEPGRATSAQAAVLMYTTNTAEQLSYAEGRRYDDIPCDGFKYHQSQQIHKFLSCELAMSVSICIVVSLHVR